LTVNLFVLVLVQQQETNMKTIAQLQVQAILTFETAGQEVTSALVCVPVDANVDLDAVEVDVLEQILQKTSWEFTEFFPTLVKVSLCYTKPPRAMAPAMQRIWDHLVRMPRSAKYYFQPDQREAAENELMARMPNVARDTSAMFA
jgi:hypothetical protein